VITRRLAGAPCPCLNRSDAKLGNRLCCVLDERSGYQAFPLVTGTAGPRRKVIKVDVGDGKAATKLGGVGSGGRIRCRYSSKMRWATASFGPLTVNKALNAMRCRCRAQNPDFGKSTAQGRLCAPEYGAGKDAQMKHPEQARV